MAERYKVEGWGGKEVELVASIDLATDVLSGWLMVVADDEKWRAIVPKGALTPVKPPTQPEPEPGAYLIGETICVRVHWKRSDPWCIVTEPDAVWTDIEWDTWPGLMEFFGPDVTITRLVPERVETVELPWESQPAGVTRTTVGVEGGQVVDQNIFPGGPYQPQIFMAPAKARAKAAALLAAASRAES